MKTYPKQTGYTLVETIVSVAIIGILAACVITALLGKTQSVQASQSGHKDQSIEGQMLTATISSSPNQLTGPAENNTLEEETIPLKTDAAARRMELRIIQTAMDLMMIQEGQKSVKETSETSDMSAFPTGFPLYPKYVREATAQFKYYCDSSGEVIQTVD